MYSTTKTTHFTFFKAKTKNGIIEKKLIRLGAKMEQVLQSYIAFLLV